MSITKIKPYFRTRLQAIGYTNEWPEAFDFENIPSTRRDKAFHILIGDVFNFDQNQTDQTMLVPVGLSVFFNATRENEQAHIDALASGEAIIKEICAPKNRVTQASDGIKDVRAQSFEVIPLSDDQQRVMRLNMAFEVLYILDFEE
jgi:hypothetical protein